MLLIFMYTLLVVLHMFLVIPQCLVVSFYVVEMLFYTCIVWRKDVVILYFALPLQLNEEICLSFFQRAAFSLM